MRPSDVSQIIHSIVHSKRKRGLYIVGSPGLGKTQICSQVARELGIGFMAVHAPLLQPEDYGFPVIGADKDSVDFVVSDEKFPLEGSDKSPECGILLIDELPQADSSAQKILANLIQEREIHGKKIKEGWSIVATGNRTTDRAGAGRLLSHLANRLTRVEMDISSEDWVNWAIGAGVAPEVISFIQFRADLLSNFDPNVEVNATPRAWAEGVSAMIGRVPKSLELSVFSGDVGEGPASEFTAFLKVVRDLPDIDDLIKNPESVKVPKELAILYAITGTLAHRTTTANFPSIMKFISKLPPEFQVLFCRNVTARDKELTKTPAFVTWMTKTGAKFLT